MSLENNLYLQSMTADQTKSMLNKKGYSPAPDLDVGVFEKNYKASFIGEGWLGRKIWAIPLAAFDITIRSIYNLFACFGYMFLDWEAATQRFYHVGRNFQIAGGRLYGIWDDCAGLKIVDRVFLNKRYSDLFSSYFQSNRKSCFFYECAMSQLSSLHDANGPSLENIVSYLEHIHPDRSSRSREQQFAFIFKILNRLFKKEIFEKYSKERLVEAYKKLIVNIHEMQFGSQMFSDRITFYVIGDGPFYNNEIRIEKGLLQELRKNIFRCHSPKDAQEIFLELCGNIPVSDKFKLFKHSEKFARNVYLAREYFLQRKEKELIEVLTESPEVVYYQGEYQEEMTAELIFKKPELFPKIFFNDKEMLPKSGSWCDKTEKFGYGYDLLLRYSSHIEKVPFFKFLLMINPHLLNINSEACKNRFFKDLLDNKDEEKTNLQIVIDEIKNPDFKFKDEEVFGDYLEKFWFVKGLIRLNPKILNFVGTNEKIKGAFLKAMPNEKQAIFKTLCTLNVASKKTNIMLPKYISRYILTLTF